MIRLKIDGNRTLTGTIRVSGAKNSAVALIPASILADDVVTIDNVPNISDIEALDEILRYLGAEVKMDGSVMTIDPSTIENKEIPESVSTKLRASYYFMAALLGKYKKVEMYFPGGCNIGKRPIDQTLKAFRALGAVVEEVDNKYRITADELVVNEIYLDMPSVGATINAILASSKAKGETIIYNAAKEPEIVNVATFLNNMGANIKGAGTSEIRIIGVEHLHGCFTEVIPDRIEAGTYVLAGALVGDNLKVDNLIPDHIEALLNKLREMGVNMKVNKDNVIISKTDNLKPVSIKTLGYPGFATDLQQPITTLLTKCNGISKLEETIYENRFQNIEYLNKLGANIELVNDRNIKVSGPSKLVGTLVKATDLRAGACLVLAGLAAEGETIIEDGHHILRGYENIQNKLNDVGAKLTIEEI